MVEYAVVTAIGADRVGIVVDITSAFVTQRCNIEESRMAVLGGEFAMILLVSGAPEDIESLGANADATASSLGMSITVKPTTMREHVAQARPYLIESVSLDTPGIVNSITSILRSYDINIEELETDTTSAPWTGAQMFVLKARISVPSTVQINRLRDQIEALAEERDLDITIQPISVGPV